MVKMIHPMMIFFVILFAFNKETFSTSLSEYVSMEYDITKNLDSCIGNIFKCANADSVWEVFSETKKSKVEEFEYKIDSQMEYFDSNVSFRDVTFFLASCVLPKFEWNFFENKLHISAEKLFFEVTGRLHVAKNESYSIHVQMNLINATITINESVKTPTHIQSSITQDSYSVLRGRLQQDMWTGENYENEEDKITIPSDKKEEMNSILLEVLPVLLIEHLDRHQLFHSIYKCYSLSKNQIISTYPDFVSNEQEFYYLIPRISFYCFYFKLVVIKGLSNFQLFQVRVPLSPFTHVLLIKNVEGRMVLDYGTTDEKPLGLTFKIDFLTLSINKEKNYASANARYYQVNGTSGPLNYRQTSVIMNGMESAIASSIMPSMKVQRTCDVKILDQQIQVSKISDWSTMKELYKEWIPFNDDNTHKTP